MYCPNCGEELPEGAKFCTNCGAALTGEEPFPADYENAGPQEPVWEAPAPGPAEAAAPGPRVNERVPLGVAGMLLGVIVAFLMPIALEPSGIWIGIQGVGMGLAVFSGYRMLGRRFSAKGIAICAVGTAAVVYLAEVFVWMLFAETAHVSTPYSGFGLLRELLRQGLGGSFYHYVILAVLFALAGGTLLAVPDLRAERLHPDRMPKLHPGLILLLIFLGSVACFVVFAAGENAEAPIRSYAYQTVTHFMRGIPSFTAY